MLNIKIFLIFLVSIPSALAQSLQYNIENLSNFATESINYGETVFSNNFNIDHSSLLFKNFNDCNNLNELGLKTTCSENSDSLWIRGYKVFNSNSEVSFLAH